MTTPSKQANVFKKADQYILENCRHTDRLQEQVTDLTIELNTANTQNHEYKTKNKRLQTQLNEVASENSSLHYALAQCEQTNRVNAEKIQKLEAENTQLRRDVDPTDPVNVSKMKLALENKRLNNHIEQTDRVNAEKIQTLEAEIIRLRNLFHKYNKQFIQTDRQIAEMRAEKDSANAENERLRAENDRLTTQAKTQLIHSALVSSIREKCVGMVAEMDQMLKVVHECEDVTEA
jgi:hypothetical protein